ncbi:hypothetical protein M569_02419, partial [Genlisea aurea]
ITMDGSVERLASSRLAMKTNLEKSKDLGSALDRVGCRLVEISQRLPSLEVAICPIRAPCDALDAVGGHIHRAVVPAAAVLKVFDAIHGLEKSLSDPQTDLPGYLGVLKRLEEALSFLAENCGMAVQWLADIVEYLEDHNVADLRFTSGLKKALKNLQELENGKENDLLDGGLFQFALERLENEFRRLLTENSFPLSKPPTLLPSVEETTISPSPLPVAVLRKLQSILSRLSLSNRLDSCISIFVEVRSSTARKSLRALNLDYLEISVSEFNDAVSTKDYTEQWGKHLEFAMKYLFEAEYKLCNDMFGRMGSNAWESCFAKIADSAGILAFLQFGKTVTESKKDPAKLLKLLDIFASLNKLRLDFNRLFGGAACRDIQNLTRDLIKRVVEGSCQIFWEMLVQVELQRQTPPPPDCGVPRVVTFITDYCNKLLGDDYKQVLKQVLTIERSWKKEKFHERILINEILNLVRAIELNLETFAKGYDDITASYLFLTNNHWHMVKHLKGTKLGKLMGDSWLNEQEQLKDHYSASFVRESWGKLPSLLSREGLILFSGGRETARALVKQRLKSFNEAFDQMYHHQSNWIIPEKEHRDRVCQDIIQTVVPAYRSYMQNYGPLVEQDHNADKYVKFTVQSMDKLFASLFLHHKPATKQGSFKLRQASG